MFPSVIGFWSEQYARVCSIVLASAASREQERKRVNKRDKYRRGNSSRFLLLDAHRFDSRPARDGHRFCSYPLVKGLDSRAEQEARALATARQWQARKFRDGREPLPNCESVYGYKPIMPRYRWLDSVRAQERISHATVADHARGDVVDREVCTRADRIRREQNRARRALESVVGLASVRGESQVVRDALALLATL